MYDTKLSFITCIIYTDNIIMHYIMLIRIFRRWNIFKFSKRYQQHSFEDDFKSILLPHKPTWWNAKHLIIPCMGLWRQVVLKETLKQIPHSIHGRCLTAATDKASITIHLKAFSTLSQFLSLPVPRNQTGTCLRPFWQSKCQREESHSTALCLLAVNAKELCWQVLCVHKLALKCVWKDGQKSSLSILMWFTKSMWPQNRDQSSSFVSMDTGWIFTSFL